MKTTNFKKEFDILYLPLCMYALRIINIREEAEDIVQHCFMAVWERISHHEDIENLKSYMYSAVRNRAITVLRTKTKEGSLNMDVEEGEYVTEDDIDTSERDAALWKAIGELPEKCREVFLKSKQEGLSNSQISEKMGISVKTVENQMTKAYSRLRETLSPKGRKVFFLPFL